MCEHMEVKEAPRIKSAPWCQSIQEVKMVPPEPEALAKKLMCRHMEVNVWTHGS